MFQQRNNCKNHIHTHARTCMHVCTHMHARTYTCMHIHMHASGTIISKEAISENPGLHNASETG